MKGNRRYQRGRHKSLSEKTDNSIANEMKRKTNTQNTKHYTKNWNKLSPIKTRLSTGATEG